jgi:hypothetical protein
MKGVGLRKWRRANEVVIYIEGLGNTSTELIRKVIVSRHAVRLCLVFAKSFGVADDNKFGETEIEVAKKRGA